MSTRNKTLRGQVNYLYKKGHSFNEWPCINLLHLSIRKLALITPKMGI